MPTTPATKTCRRDPDETASWVGHLYSVPLRRFLFGSVLGFDAALFGQQGHGTHQVLHADDADYLAALGDGNQGEALAIGDAANGGAEGVLGSRNLEGARHDGLNVAVAVVAECVDYALA